MPHLLFVHALSPLCACPISSVHAPSPLSMHHLLSVRAPSPLCACPISLSVHACWPCLSSPLLTQATNVSDFACTSRHPCVWLLFRCLPCLLVGGWCLLCIGLACLLAMNLCVHPLKPPYTLLFVPLACLPSGLLVQPHRLQVRLALVHSRRVLLIEQSACITLTPS